MTYPEHGVVVAAAPWADHDARFTRDLRRAGGLAGGRVLEEHARRTDASQLAERGPDSGAGVGFENHVELRSAARGAG